MNKNNLYSGIEIKRDMLHKQFILSYKGKTIQVVDISQGRTGYYNETGEFCGYINKEDGLKHTMINLEYACKKLKGVVR